MTRTSPSSAERMRQELQRIYQDLQAGRLSKQRALEKISLLKRDGSRQAVERQAVELVLAVPEWELAGGMEGRKVVYAERHVVLCGLSKVGAEKLEELIRDSQCVQWQAPDADDVGAGYGECALACFHKVQGILRGRPQGKVLLQIVLGEGGESGLLAGLSGLLKTASLENPQFLGQIILSESQITAAELAWQLQGDAGLAQDSIIRHAQGGRWVLRWQTVRAPQRSPAVAFKDRGVYLITGGLGGVGLLFAREILQRTSQARVILTGRGPLTPEKRAKLAALGAGAQQLEYRQVELVELAALERLIESVQQGYGQLNGILHCAGMIADNFLVKKTAAEFAAVLAPKVSGTVNLELASRERDLDFLVLFSSIAGALGNAGQADYAAANGFMDEFAGYSNAQAAARGRAGYTVSINWPLWEAGGMSIEQESWAILEQATGALPMRTATGLRAFYHALSLPTARSLVVEGVLEKIREKLCPESAPPEAPKTSMAPAVDPQLIQEKTLHRVKQLFAGVIKLQPERIDTNKELSEYGIDSLMVTRLNDEFSKIFGALSKTVFFEYKSLAGLTTYFLEHHTERCLALTGLQPRDAAQENTLRTVSATTASTGTPARAQPRRTGGRMGITREPRREKGREPIAIIGLSGIYPQAQTLQQYWDNLKQGKDCITEIPAKRWPLEGFFDQDPMRAVERGRGYCKWGGFVDQFDQFDPLFFGISPQEALSIDPQERMFLQATWHALESAGYTRLDLQQKFQRQVGVFAGITKQGFNLHGSEAARRDQKFYPHTSFSSLANRVSYVLDITGPSMPIDTMCSSSLTAIHEACEHIYRGDCAMAFAGGVNLYLHPSTYVDMAAQYALSRDGKCRSFGAGASGFVPGEGVGAVLLKPLAAALADKDAIHGLILATHVNHGGKTNGYTVPNPRAQAELIRGAIQRAGISARDISYIEAHGTGTELGDPIEMEGLRQAFSPDSSDIGYCRVGSAKSNIGHLEAAAGMAGLTKVLLQMKHAQIAPSLHAEAINPEIRFDGTPFVLNRTLTSWEQRAGPDGKALPRTAGISSFGAGGANAHVIVQEFSPTTVARFPRSITADQRVIVPLSAKTPVQLRQSVIALLDFLGTEKEGSPAGSAGAARGNLDLAELAYTLQVGREALDERLGLVVESVGELARKLRAYLDGDENVEELYRRRTARGDQDISILNSDDDMQLAVSRWLARKKLSKLVELWVDGLTFDWDELYGESKPGRMDLPVYPFSDERYWMAATETERRVTDVTPRTPRRIGSLEDILNRIDSDSLRSDEAVGLLRVLM